MFGLDLPALPGSYLTRQVTCVSCQEPFVVSEGKIIKNEESDEGESQRRWRLSLDSNPSVRLRYLHNRYRQEVQISSRADPGIHHESEMEEVNSPDNYVNCPRCGADNRNWIEINAPRHHVGTGLLDMLLPLPLSRWRQRFPSAFASILLSVFFGILIIILSATETISFAQALLIAIVAIMTVIGVADDLTKYWLDIRMEMHTRRLPLKKRRIGLNSLPVRGLILIILFAAIFPWLFFRVGPRAMQLGARVVRPASRNSLAIPSDKKYPLELYEEFVPALNMELRLFFHDFGNTKVGNASDLTAIFMNLNQLSQNVTETTEQYRKGLEAFVNDPPKGPEQVQNEAEDKEIKSITNNLMFLVLWFIIVGGANAAAIFFSIKSAYEFAGFVDSQLPPPIFHSVANMTRVVIWEAKRALQIDGDMSHIQWVEVHRNDVGGINLYGLHREQPVRNDNHNNLSSRVRAQRHIISTDMWGRILEVIVQDIRVPRTVLVPKRSRATERPGFNDYNLNGEPPSSSGDNLAKGFFLPAAKSPSSNGEAKAQHEHSCPTDSVVHDKACEETDNKTKSQSKAWEQAIYKTEAQSSTTDKYELLEKLATILCREFTLKELYLFYSDLGLDYEQIPGSRLEKCQDLVRFYYRHQRIAELVQECLDSHPYLPWGDIFDLLDA